METIICGVIIRGAIDLKPTESIIIKQNIFFSLKENIIIKHKVSFL